LASAAGGLGESSWSRGRMQMRRTRGGRSREIRPAAAAARSRE
jgi:hypothetical protein